ncbi:hypothetical protein KR222_000488, partial [Zaprionus bogoriensis]
GGALIAPNVVLTAAHIIKNYEVSNIMVRVGAWDMSNEIENFESVVLHVSRKILHETFDSRTGFDNIALLILEQPVALTAHIRTICLPDEYANFEGQTCIVTGWGKKTVKDAHLPNILKKIELPFINNQNCQELLRKTNLGNSFELDTTLLCAGGELNKDACHGDGGSPLVCQLPGDTTRYQLVGLVAWGLECGKKDVPGVYTNVQMLLPWIRKKLKLHSISP